MKKLLLTLTMLALLGFLSACAWLEEPEIDYRAAMIEAAVHAEEAAGQEAAALRNAVLDAQGSGEARIDFDELLLLARALTLRAGEERLTDELRLCAGEVLLNRVASPEFPDTLREVLAEEGGYEGLDGVRPDRRSAETAWELLAGRRLLDRRVLYQSDGRPSGPVYATFCDRYYRYTYFCLTEHPELYEETLG